MSEESKDSDSSCEWILVNSDGETVLEPLHQTSENVSTVDNISALYLPKSEQSAESDISDDSIVSIHSEEKDLLIENNDVIQPISSSSNSDIERIEEDGGDAMLSFDTSVLTSSSKFSFISPSEILEADLESLVSNDSVSIISEDHSDNSIGSDLVLNSHMEQVRIYKHIPNRTLNLSLNLLLVLSLTAVIGLGIGHFLGWSSQWIRQHHIHQSQITKLKTLQDELIVCLQQQNLKDISFDLHETESRHHLQNLEEINKELKAKLMLEIQKDDDSALMKNGQLHQEFNNLYLEHEHNAEKDYSKDDSIIKLEVGSLRQQINHLQLENEDLRRVIVRLRYGKPLNKVHQEVKSEAFQIESKEVKATPSSSSEDQQAKLFFRNISRNHSDINSLKVLVKKLQKTVEKEKNETRKWKQLCKHLNFSENKTDKKNSYFSLVNFLDFIGVASNDSLKLLLTSEELNRVNKTWLYELWSSVRKDEFFGHLQQSLQEKWTELQNFSYSNNMKSSKGIIKKMHKVLKKTVHKFKSIGEKIMKPSKKSIKKLASNFMNKLSNLVVKLDEKWFNIKSKFSFHQENDRSYKYNLKEKSKRNEESDLYLIQSDRETPSFTSPTYNYMQEENRRQRKYNRKSKHSEQEENNKKAKSKKQKKKNFQLNNENQSLFSDDDYDWNMLEAKDSDGNWIFERSKFRESQHNKFSKNEWYFDRAKDREEHHLPKKSEFYQKWFVRRAKGRDFQRSETLNKNDWFLSRKKETDFFAEENFNKNKKKDKKKESRKHKSEEEEINQPFGIPDVHYKKAYFTCDV